MTSENPTDEHQPENHADAKPSHKAQTGTEFSPSGRVAKSETPPTPCSYQITCKTDKDWRDKAKFWAEMLGLIVLIAYTIFTGLMYCANKKAADAAKSAADTAANSLKISERAYLGTDRPSQVPEGIYLKVVNYGHSPASNVLIHVDKMVAPFFTQIPKSLDLRETVTAYGSDKNIIPPNGYYDLVIQLSDIGIHDFAGLGLNKRVLYIQTTVEYGTIFGEKESIETCFLWNPSHPTFVSCPPNIIKALKMWDEELKKRK